MEDQKDKNSDLVSLIETLYSSSSTKIWRLSDLNNYRRSLILLLQLHSKSPLKMTFTGSGISELNNRELTEADLKIGIRLNLYIKIYDNPKIKDIIKLNK